MAQTLIRTLLLMSCFSLSGCLVHSGIVTENLESVYVHDPEEALLIAGATANVADLASFVIDNPIAYGKPVKNAMGDPVETSKTYTNADGDKLIFNREYRPSTKQYFESVIVKPKAGVEYKLQRMRGYLGMKRKIAYGFCF